MCLMGPVPRLHEADKADMRNLRLLSILQSFFPMIIEVLSRGLPHAQEIEQFVKNDVYIHNKLVTDW